MSNCSLTAAKACSNVTTNSYVSGTSNKVTLTLLGILAALILIANSTVIFLYKTNRYLRTVTNLCLVFLAVSDLLSSLVAIPMIIICDIHFNVCTAMDLASRFIAISTILHLMIVSTERYVMIVFPMHYIKMVSKRKVIVALAGVWIFSLTISLVQLLWVLDEEGPSTKHFDLVYSLTTFFGIVFPVLCFMVLIYSHIFIVIRRQIKSIKRHNVPASFQSSELTERGQFRRGESRPVVVFALMIFTFVLGWFPYFILTFLNDFNVSLNPSVFWLFLRFTTSLVNPLLYTFLKMDFKKAMIRPKRKAKLSYKSVETKDETRL